MNVAAHESNPYALRDAEQLVEAAGMEYCAILIQWEKPDVNRVVEVVENAKKILGK